MVKVHMNKPHTNSLTPSSLTPSSLTPNSLTPNPSPKERGVECSAGVDMHCIGLLRGCLETYYSPLLWRGVGGEALSPLERGRG